MNNNIFIETDNNNICVYRDGVLLNRRSAIDALFNLYHKEPDKTSEGAQILSGLIRDLYRAS